MSRYISYVYEETLTCPKRLVQVQCGVCQSFVRFSPGFTGAKLNRTVEKFKAMHAHGVKGGKDAR